MYRDCLNILIICSRCTGTFGSQWILNQLEHNTACSDHCVVMRTSSACVVLFHKLIHYHLHCHCWCEGSNIEIKSVLKFWLKLIFYSTLQHLAFLTGLFLHLLLTVVLGCPSQLLLNIIFLRTGCMKWEQEIIPHCRHKSKTRDWSSKEKYMA